MADHSGHIINVKPRFKCVQQGQSGTKEPDWQLAPNRGDRLADGSCIWENTGDEEATCVSCGRVLTEKEYRTVRRAGIKPHRPN
jgi:hypothetical protein